MSKYKNGKVKHWGKGNTEVRREGVVNYKSFNCLHIISRHLRICTYFIKTEMFQRNKTFSMYQESFKINQPPTNQKNKNKPSLNPFKYFCDTNSRFLI